MIKKSQLKDFAVSSTLMNIVADVGKYSSLLYGIANIIGDEPNIKQAVYAGIGYVVSGLVGHMAKGILMDASREPLRETLDTIAEKLDVHIE